MSKLKIITVIAARGGSKSCPRKNIRKVRGKPLIAYPIITSIKTPEIQETYVSTDDGEIANISKHYGAYVPFLRPAKYATDTSLDIEWAQHFLKWFYKTHKYYPKMMVHLRATTPLIEVSELQRAIIAFKKDKEATSLLSIEEYTHSPYKSILIEGKYCSGLINIKNHERPKQSFPTVYNPNGYVDILRPSEIVVGRFHGDKILPFITEKVIEIDSEYDFELLEMYMQKKRGKV